ncbi:MAG: hypothetical protein JJU16_03030 [Alkalibacterium sp.]|nr:hypothetical protein [Alkalibacterium sp.]
MNRLTKRDVMLKGVIKDRKKNILEVGKRRYLVTDYLIKTIRLKKWLLGLMTVLFSLAYHFNMGRYYDIPFAEAESVVIVEGLTITFLFMLAVVGGYILISIVLIPKDFEKHIRKELF